MTEAAYQRYSFSDLRQICLSDESVRGWVASNVPDVPAIPFFAHGKAEAGVAIILGGQHGDEPSGVAVVTEVGRRLKGLASVPRIKILGLPAVNMLACRSRTRVWAGDRLDMNRMFDPIEGHEGPTAEIARQLLAFFENIPLRLLIDVHSGGEHELVTHIRSHENGGRDFWSTAGVNWVQRFFLPRGFLIRALPERGVPAFTLEVGKEGINQQEVSRATDGILSTLAGQGWIDTEVVEGTLRIMKTTRREKPNVTGLFHRTTSLGSLVSLGVQIGVITEITSGTSHILSCSAIGILAGAAKSGLVTPKTSVYELVNEDALSEPAVAWESFVKRGDS